MITYEKCVSSNLRLFLNGDRLTKHWLPPILWSLSSFEELSNFKEYLMANHKSAEKRIRQNAKRNEINRSNRSKLRTQIKKLRVTIAGADKAQGGELLSPTVSVIDKAVNKGIIHRNTAARYKSRLTKHVAEIA